MPRILVVDDRKDTLTSIKAMISKMDPMLEIITADNGAAGMDMARRHLPDLILLDIQMPEMNGYEVCLKLKIDERTKPAPVIFLTSAKTSPADRIKGHEIGADAFLSKPVDEGELMAVIRAMLRIKKAEDQLRSEKSQLENEVLLRNEELFKINQRYERLVRNAPDMIYRMSLPDGKYDFVSNSTSIITGYSPQEFYDKPFLIRDILHPDWLDYFEAEWQKLVEGKPEKQYTYQIINKSGDLRWLSQKNVLIRNSRGEPSAIEGIVRDITIQMENQKALKETNQKFQSLFDNMMNGFAFHQIITDDSGHPIDYLFLEINPAFEKLTGLKRDKLIGKRVTQILPGTENDPANWIKVYGKVALTGEPITFQNYSEALEKWFSIMAYSPNAGYFATIFQDISSYKKAEIALQASEEKYRLMFETAPVGVITVNLKGIITSTNAAFNNMSEFHQGELVDMHFTKYPGFRINEIPRYVKIFKSLLKGIEPEPLIEKWKTKNKVEKIAEVLIVPEKINGKVLGLHAFIRDITQQYKYESSLKTSLKEKEVLLREVHHRVKNNMQIITSLLSLQSVKIENETAAQALKDSKNRIISMSLVHETLFQSEDFIQIQLRNYLEKIMIHLVQVFQTSDTTVSYQINTQPLIIQIEEAIPLGLVINELVTNSLKHGFMNQQEGNIILDVEQAGDSKLIFSYEDNGAGLPVDFNLSKVSSLGLRLVHDLITKQLQGKIKILDGPGARFSFQINSERIRSYDSKK